MAIPVFAPDGTLRDIPEDQVQSAISAGGKQAVAMTDPQGTGRWVPHDQVQNAIQAGGKVGQPSAQEFADRGQNAEGGFKAIGSDLAGMAKSLPLAGNPYYQARNLYETAKSAPAEWSARKQAGHETAYNLGAVANEALGVNVKGEEQAAAVGDTGGVVGHAAAVPAAMAITAGIAKGVPAAAGLGGKIARGIAEKSIEQTLRPAPKMFRFGKDPVGFVLDNNITANSIPELKANIDAAIQGKTAELNGVLANAPKVDLQPAALDLQNAIRRAGTKRTMPVARQLSKLYNDMFVNKPMIVSAADAAEIKRGIQESINWESDGPGLSSAKKQLQHSVGEQIYKVAPDARPISEDISSGIEASKAAETQVLKGKAVKGLAVVRPGIVGATIGSAVGAVVGAPIEGAAVGSMADIGATNAMRYPAVATRVGAGFNKVGGFADPFGQTQIPARVGYAPLGSQRPKDTKYPY